jgi:hypothetical protein
MEPDYSNMQRVEWPYSQICGNCIYGHFVHEDNNPCLYYCEINKHPDEYGKCKYYVPLPEPPEDCLE